MLQYRKKEIEISIQLYIFTSFLMFSLSLCLMCCASFTLFSLLSLHQMHARTHTHAGCIICHFPDTRCAMYQLSQQGPPFEWLSDFCSSDKHPIRIQRECACVWMLRHVCVSGCGAESFSIRPSKITPLSFPYCRGWKDKRILCRSNSGRKREKKKNFFRVL